MPQAGGSRYCSGCVTKALPSGICANAACRWKEDSEPEAQEHLPRHYILVGRYYMGRVLGQGGFGVTYIARDLKLDRAVAIKEFLPTDQCSRSVGRTMVRSLSGEKSGQFRLGLQRFLSEAQNIARLGGHPNIVPITDHIEANGTAYMVMEFIEGMTLKQFLAHRGGRIPPETATGILLHAMAGLKKMHEQSLLHRDISPDNIMIASRGPVKLIDFGAARQVLGEASRNLTVILKHGYAPQEQYLSKGNQGPWTDVYATAATLYRCVAGVVPPPALDRAAGAAVLERPAKFCPQISPGLEAAIIKGLSIKAETRFRSIAELQNAILARNSGDVPVVQVDHVVVPANGVRPLPVRLAPAVVPGATQPPQPIPQPSKPVLLLMPPSMHWLAVLACTVVTGGWFAVAWMFVQANFVRKIDPGSKARKLFALYTVFSLLAFCTMMVGCLEVASQPGSTSDSIANAFIGLLLPCMEISLFGTLFFYLGLYDLRRSLLDYYNRVEPIDLELSAGMTFFCTLFYLQFHLSRIAMYKRTGFLPA